MNKKVFGIIIGAILATTLTGCFEKEPDPKVIELEAKLERMEAEERAREAELAAERAAELEAERAAKEAELAEAEAKDKERLQKELEDLKAKVNKAPAPVVNKFGPGNGNNLRGYSEGYLRIHTRSANGKLTLRDEPAQNGNKLLEIPNGTDEIYYFETTKIGEYVWYKVDYYGNVGYLRGDYVHRY